MEVVIEMDESDMGGYVMSITNGSGVTLVWTLCRQIIMWYDKLVEDQDRSMFKKDSFIVEVSHSTINTQKQTFVWVWASSD